LEELQDPIAHILSEHDRQLEVCGRLEDLVADPTSDTTVQLASSILEFLSEDLPLHIEDEEQALFPLLTSRQANDPNLSVILDQLTSEHELDRDLVEPIVEGLRDIAKDRKSTDLTRFCVHARTFTEVMRRHLNWENHIVLPLAEKVLNDVDRKQLARNMIGRRRARNPGSG